MGNCFSSCAPEEMAPEAGHKVDTTQVERAESHATMTSIANAAEAGSKVASLLTTRFCRLDLESRYPNCILPPYTHALAIA